MTSNSNYSIGLQRLKPVHTAQFGRKLVLGTRRKWPRPRRDRDETETRRWYVARPSRDRDVETETSRPRPQPCNLHFTVSRPLDLLICCTYSVPALHAATWLVPVLPRKITSIQCIVTQSRRRLLPRVKKLTSTRLGFFGKLF